MAKRGSEKWREAISRNVTKLTPEVVTKLKDAYAVGATDEQACFYAEITVRTLQRWRKKYPILCREFKRMKDKLPLAAKNNIADAIQRQKDLPISRWLLERRESQEYAEKMKLEHSGKIDQTLDPEDQEVLKAFHEGLKNNIKNKNLKKAKEDGEII